MGWIQDYDTGHEYAVLNDAAMEMVSTPESWNTGCQSILDKYPQAVAVTAEGYGVPLRIWRKCTQHVREECGSGVQSTPGWYYSNLKPLKSESAQTV